MLGLRMVTAKKSTKRHAVRSSAVAIMGGSRSANAARGPAGAPWTSCWVMKIVLFFGGIRESYKKTIITTFMKGFILGVTVEPIDNVSRAGGLAVTSVNYSGRSDSSSIRRFYAALVLYLDTSNSRITEWWMTLSSAADP